MRHRRTNYCVTEKRWNSAEFETVPFYQAYTCHDEFFFYSRIWSQWEVLLYHVRSRSTNCMGSMHSFIFFVGVHHIESVTTAWTRPMTRFFRRSGGSLNAVLVWGKSGLNMGFRLFDLFFRTARNPRDPLMENSFRMRTRPLRIINGYKIINRFSSVSVDLLWSKLDARTIDGSHPGGDPWQFRLK